MTLRLSSVTLPLLLLLTGSACAGGKDVVERLIEAFNRHDVEAMLALTADDVRWMSVADDRVFTEAGSADELGEAMAGYFSGTPGARAEIRSITESGPFVHITEEAFWIVAGEERSQCAMAVYEVTGEKVKQVWYFPAHACPIQPTAAFGYAGQGLRGQETSHGAAHHYDH